MTASRLNAIFCGTNPMDNLQVNSTSDDERNDRDLQQSRWDFFAEQTQRRMWKSIQRVTMNEVASTSGIAMDFFCRTKPTEDSEVNSTNDNERCHIGVQRSR